MLPINVVEIPTAGHWWLAILISVRTYEAEPQWEVHMPSGMHSKRI